MQNLFKTATRPSFANKAKFMTGMNGQRSLHTPLGTTRAKDDAFQVSQLEIGPACTH